MERPKCSLVTKTQKKVVLRKTILKQGNLAKDKGSKAQFTYKDTEMPVLRNIMLKTAELSRKQTKMSEMK